MRKNIVAGNWKMNTTIEEGKQLAKDIAEKFSGKNVELIIAPPFTHMDSVAQIIGNTNIELASQNVAKEDFGAYTGEIAAEMVKSIGAAYSIIGHSERRAYYGENNTILLAKVKKALSVNLKPIFCVGENLEERESGQYFEIIKKQLEEGLFELSDIEFSKIIIAYEPVWAIGTGVTASPEQAQEVHAFIRKMVAENYNTQISNDLSILYGGSCNPKNAKELFSKEDIDGGLIGGAALKADDFIAISKSF